MKTNPPEVSPDLVLYLDAAFPVQRPPFPSLTDHEMWMRAGERRLIDHLISLVKRQHGLELETTRVFIKSSKATSGGSASAPTAGP